MATTASSRVKSREPIGPKPDVSLTGKVPVLKARPASAGPIKLTLLGENGELLGSQE